MTIQLQKSTEPSLWEIGRKQQSSVNATDHWVEAALARILCSKPFSSLWVTQTIALNLTFKCNFMLIRPTPKN